ncbi:MAG: hypothetical protein VX730_04495 [Pseudomonadota bacterium]|nr:hypothetical protein [Pseudomonadota bacterium]
MFKKSVCMTALVLLSGCGGVSIAPHKMVSEAKPREHKYGGGILVAESEIVEYEHSKTEYKDCDNTLPLEIAVQSSTSRHAELYESAREHCGHAEIIFDGQTPEGQRSADPAIQIKFTDFKGAPIQSQTKSKNIVIALEGEEAVLPSDFSLKPQTQAAKVQIARNTADPYTKTVSDWQENRERTLLLKESEKLLANVRDLDRMKDTAIIAAHQKEIQRLLAKLRNLEVEDESKQERNEEALAMLDKTRLESEARRRQQEQEHSHLRSKLEEQAARIIELEKQKQAMDHQMARKQDVYTQQLERLSTDLKIAEAMAEKGRQELVLEAASKIAEAERLAFAAKMQEKASMEREAERLRDEADSIMARAHTLSGGRQIIIPGLTPLSKTVFNRSEAKLLSGTTALVNEWTDIPLVDRQGNLRLEDIELAIYEEDKTIPEILESVFTAINTRAPGWRTQFELPENRKYVLEEKWTIAAESRLDELLSYIANRVKTEHGVQLSFQQFDATQLLLVGVWDK